MINKSNKVAEIVLGIFNHLYGDRIKGYANTYHNGRENGYSLHVMRHEGNIINDLKYALVCENRNSDFIVVYIVTDGFDDELTEEAYNNRKYFDPEDFLGAARYIFESLTGEAI